MIDRRVVGIGHLTMLDVAPPDLVTFAADAGFDAVGIRAATASDAEQAWPMQPGSPMLAETLHRLDGTGTVVLDVEIVRLAPTTTAAAHRQLFEVGATLGASVVNVIAFDPDLGRATDTFAALAAEAAPFGLRPMLEPMIYSSVRNLAAAVSIVDGSGGGLIVDPLHLRRFGGSPDDLRALDPALLPYYQLCDAPLAAPSGLPRPSRLARNQPLDIDDMALEARSVRLLPGDGELPLAAIVEVMPDGVPVSLEAPNQALFERLGPAAYAQRARRSMAAVLAGHPTGTR